MSDSDFSLDEETSFQFVTRDEILSRLKSMVERVSELSGLPFGACFYLLHLNNFRLNEVFRKVLEGLPPSFKQLKRVDLIVEECMTCLATNTPGRSMGCMHGVCHECYDRYLQIEMLENFKLFSTRCIMGDSCNLNVPFELTNLKFDEFLNLAANSYVVQMQYRQCPHPNCIYFAYSDLPVNGPCVCKCGRTFCFNCKLPFDHLALSCKHSRNWLQLAASDGLNTVYLQQNSKMCPKCLTVTERDGGCNHIVCSVCKFEYCWACTNEWSRHRSWYNCIHFNETKSVKQTKKKESKQNEKLVFYGSRFINHSMLAQQADSELYRNGHNLLSWAFALLFYLNNVNEKALLENLVTSLSIDIESESGLLAKRIDQLHEFIMETKWDKYIAY